MLRLVFLLCIFMMPCNGHSKVEKEFFHNPRPDRVERLRHYGLEDQYRIFRYGNDKVEPPALELADPIAERGAAAIPFLSDQLQSSTDDLAVRDILLIFRRMVSLKTYDVKRDDALMGVLKRRISLMKSRDWQAFCREKLESIANAP